MLVVTTPRASRHVGIEGSEATCSGPGVGKKIRKRKSLEDFVSFAVADVMEGQKTYMRPKQLHCTATCAIPNSPATQANPLISLQHAISC